MICQIGNPEIELPCPEREGDGNGYQCENLEPLPHRHFVGKHTIEHRFAGNGYACSAIVEEDDNA